MLIINIHNDYYWISECLCTHNYEKYFDFLKNNKDYFNSLIQSMQDSTPYVFYYEIKNFDYSKEYDFNDFEVKYNLDEHEFHYLVLESKINKKDGKIKC